MSRLSQLTLGGTVPKVRRTHCGRRDSRMVRNLAHTLANVLDQLLAPALGPEHGG